MKKSILNVAKGLSPLEAVRQSAFCLIVTSATLVLPVASQADGSLTNCFSYTNFNSTNDLALTGNSLTTTGGVLRLTAAVSGQMGNAWRSDPQACAGGFDTRFHFQISDIGSFPGTPSGGDGFAFAVQSVGPGDTDLLSNLSTATNYISVFFNTFLNWPGCSDYQQCDLSANSVGVVTNGLYVAQADLDLFGINLKDGAVHSSRIVYDGVGLSVWIDERAVLTNVPAAGLKPGTGGSGQGWVGFSSFTGWAWENHDILDWSFCGSQPAPTAPYITTQPASQTATAGATANFSVVAGGTPPLTYQWTFAASNISGATASSLTLTNIQHNQAGNYAVVVSNSANSVTSSNAVLTVSYPPATVRVTSVTKMGGATFTVPVVLMANGNENALGFSLNFDPARLSYSSVTLGPDAGHATLLVNHSQAGNGVLGIGLSLSSGEALPAGTLSLVEVAFMAAVVTNQTSTAVNFAGSPVVRQLADVGGNPLPVNFVNGAITLTATEFEGDVAPRPTGDGAVTITDWVLIGRFAARLDYPTNASEFQRADCAPRATLGDGKMTVSDWVQAGRYAIGLDPLTPVGGPTNETRLTAGPAPLIGSGSGGPSPLPLSTRQLQVVDATLTAGQVGSISINLLAQGNENALGLSLSFDSTNFTYSGLTLGHAASGATLDVNSGQAASGKVACVLALGTGSNFAAGTDEVLKLSLQPATKASGSYQVALSDLPVLRETADATANMLATTYINGTIMVNALPPLLSIGVSGGNVTLSWPGSTSGFVLQECAGGLLQGPAAWSDVSLTPATNNGQNTVSLTAGNGPTFYRLYKP